MDPSLFSIVFPNELIDAIVEFILVWNTKFSSIASFTLASTTFRLIALRRFFLSLHLSNSAHWTRLHRVLIAQGEQAFTWVRCVSVLVNHDIHAHLLVSRNVHAPAETFSTSPMLLYSLPNLKTLAIDFAHAGVATQQALLKKICKFPQPPTSNPPSPMGSPRVPKSLLRATSLTLTALPCIDKALLTLLAKTFPYLTRLDLSCTDRLDLGCCWDCFQESASCAIGISPIPDMFADVGHLAVRLKHFTSASH